MARKAAPAAGAIRFVEDFDHVQTGRTVAYKAGHVVEAPDEALITAAGAKAEPVSGGRPEEAADDGE